MMQVQYLPPTYNTSRSGWHWFTQLLYGSVNPKEPHTAMVNQDSHKQMVINQPALVNTEAPKQAVASSVPALSESNEPETLVPEPTVEKPHTTGTGANVGAPQADVVESEKLHNFHGIITDGNGQDCSTRRRCTNCCTMQCVHHPCRNIDYNCMKWNPRIIQVNYGVKVTTKCHVHIYIIPIYVSTLG